MRGQHTMTGTAHQQTTVQELLHTEMQAVRTMLGALHQATAAAAAAELQDTAAGSGEVGASPAQMTAAKAPVRIRGSGVLRSHAKKAKSRNQQEKRGGKKQPSNVSARHKEALCVDSVPDKGTATVAADRDRVRDSQRQTETDRDSQKNARTLGQGQEQLPPPPTMVHASTRETQRHTATHTDRHRDTHAPKSLSAAIRPVSTPLYECLPFHSSHSHAFF